MAKILLLEDDRAMNGLVATCFGQKGNRRFGRYYIGIERSGCRINVLRKTVGCCK